MLKVYREYHYVMSEQRKLRETGYAAITYTDHYTGEPEIEGRKIDGTEDFTLERWNKQVTRREIYQPTGKLNKGNKMIWDRTGSVYARTAADCGKIARLVLGKEISVRQY